MISKTALWSLVLTTTIIKGQTETISSMKKIESNQSAPIRVKRIDNELMANGRTKEKFSKQIALSRNEGKSEKNELSYSGEFELYSGDADTGLSEFEAIIVTLHDTTSKRANKTTIPQYANENFEEVETNKHLSKITILLLISKIFLLGLVAFRKYKKLQIARYQVENYFRIEAVTDEETL